MTFPPKYFAQVIRHVHRHVPALGPVFSALLLTFLLASPSVAQSHGDSPSSSSSGAGSGHSYAGGGATFTSSGPASHTSAGATTFATSSHSGGNPHSGNSWHSTTGWNNSNRHHHQGTSTGEVYYPYPYLYPVPVPYAADEPYTDAADSQDDDADYRGGPTVFDRRGEGAASYIPPVDPGPAHSKSADSNSASEPVPEPTLLVFKDGHQLEVENYAVVSQTLYDLTPGHSRKIALADLDLPATEKQNDDRGIVFQLPSLNQAD